MKLRKILNGVFLAGLISASFLQFTGCKSKAKGSSADEIVREWMGKTINFPATSKCSVLGESSPCSFGIPKPYKILLYTDSTGCTSCKLRIDIWKDRIKDADTSLAGKVDFVFHFYPKNKDVLRNLMKRENFIKPVFVDENDELNELNHFPTNMDYQCFLLDKDNKVLLVGNPSSNYQIWELEKKIIRGEKIN